jgi:hypothetical protein
MVEHKNGTQQKADTKMAKEKLRISPILLPLIVSMGNAQWIPMGDRSVLLMCLLAVHLILLSYIDQPARSLAVPGVG